ncbi:glycosyltransferase family 2 protein [Paraburkholderia sp. CNPSo 3274]|uniref:glycosyltransferase family A protein n=1 Tax=Paraburkholderia sp. CNPSo 3274 TaxID=2940932 RepID=UPI0020B7CC10|nr:glycosyltransferase family A protein [Paraburkholderia sp. CNPSo 3274]MCP3709796.1 glycosyltransferase family 2 protein [Paraburkholderia sp. CNPSo 3274]
MGALPLISCVMPTYGRPSYVNESVAMFLAQDYPQKELIILNDCVGQQFLGEFPDVRIVNRSSRFASLGEKRNACISLARGPVIAIWDDDDVYLPWRLSFSWSEMEQLGTSFYRPAQFWAYWGNADLHENQAVPGWVSHQWVLFRKDLWDKVGGYPAIDLGEDAQFFERVHRELGETFIKYELVPGDRFGILRGTSEYQHMSIGGGVHPLDTTPDDYRIVPTAICDPILRGAHDRLVANHAGKVGAFCESNSAFYRVVHETGIATKPALSVCVSVKNRSRIKHGMRELRPFPHCVSCLANSYGPDMPIELVVSDFASDDWPLIEWISDCAAGMPVRVVSLGASFSRGRGLNVAAAHARSDRLLLCDADLLISLTALRRAIEIIDCQKAWFPICRCLAENGTPDCWLDPGYGVAGVSRSVFNATGGLPEFRSWGGEDDIFAARVGDLLERVRERFDGIRHQWHPDWCRFENYERPRFADYHEHTEARLLRASMQSGEVLKIFRAVHPHWQGTSQLLVLLRNGRMERPGADRGKYVYEEEKHIALKWDHWPVEILTWDDSQRIFRDPTKPFTLMPVAI